MNGINPCRKTGCRNMGIKKYAGYCELHKEDSGWFRVSKRKGNRHQRGYGNDWVKLRSFILKRDDYLCVLCEKNRKCTPATTVDHIIPKSQGGTDKPKNLQSLCMTCHNKKTATESQK